MVGPRFEQTAEQFQPRPLAAIELIAQEPVIKVAGRVAACDGGKQQQPITILEVETEGRILLRRVRSSRPVGPGWGSGGQLRTRRSGQDG